MSSTGSGWSQLRQQVRALESQTDSLFHTYSQYAASSHLPPKPSEEEQKTEKQILELLEKRSNILTQMTRLLDSDPNNPPTSSTLRQSNLNRHHEILSEHRSSLSRLRNAISDARTRANLLSTVRSDIHAYRSANSASSSSTSNKNNRNKYDPEQAEADYMLDERRRLDNSNSIADGVLSQAYAVNENFGLQRETLTSINRKIVGAAGQVPGMNALIARIGSKKRRDGIILGSFIAFCFLLLYYFR